MASLRKMPLACEDFQALCLASEGGTFAMLAPDEVPGEVERIYAQSSTGSK